MREINHATKDSIAVGAWDVPDCSPPAYAMLYGPPDFKAYVIRHYTVLGRLGRSTCDMALEMGLGDPIGLAGKPGEVDVHIADDDSVARQHAVISFNSQKKGFEISVLGDCNVVFVHGVVYAAKDGPVAILSRATIQVSHRPVICAVCFMFYVLC